MHSPEPLSPDEFTDRFPYEAEIDIEHTSEVPQRDLEWDLETWEWRIGNVKCGNGNWGCGVETWLCGIWEY